MTHGRQQIDIFSQNEEHYSWFSRTLQMPLTYFKKYVNDKYMMLLSIAESPLSLVFSAW